MRRLMTSLLAAAVVLAAPAAASADGFLSPYIGVNFGGDTPKKSTGFGGALGFIGDKAGFEFDVSYTPEFFGDDTFDVDGKLVTVMGNVLVGGRRGGFSPYCASAACTRASSHSRLSIVALCVLAQAPMREPSGRDAKYSSLSAALTFSTEPSMRTCRSSSFQKKVRAARGRVASSRPLRLS